jgi:hypothetical protein
MPLSLDEGAAGRRVTAGEAEASPSRFRVACLPGTAAEAASDAVLSLFHGKPSALRSSRPTTLRSLLNAVTEYITIPAAPARPAIG